MKTRVYFYTDTDSMRAARHFDCIEYDTTNPAECRAVRYEISEQIERGTVILTIPQCES